MSRQAWSGLPPKESVTGPEGKDFVVAMVQHKGRQDMLPLWVRCTSLKLNGKTVLAFGRGNRNGQDRHVELERIIFRSLKDLEATYECEALQLRNKKTRDLSPDFHNFIPSVDCFKRDLALTVVKHPCVEVDGVTPADKRNHPTPDPAS